MSGPLTQCLACGEVMAHPSHHPSLHVKTEHHPHCSGTCGRSCPTVRLCGPLIEVTAPLSEEERRRVEEARLRILYAGTLRQFGAEAHAALTQRTVVVSAIPGLTP